MNARYSCRRYHLKYANMIVVKKPGIIFNMRTFLLAIVMFFSLDLLSQSHPTISNFSASYKSVNQTSVTPTSTLAASNSPKKVVNLVFDLVDISQVSEISCKIISATSALAYEVSYNIVDTKHKKENNGRTLLKIEGSTVYINPPTYLDMAAYTIELTTKSNSGVVSPVFTYTN